MNGKEIANKIIEEASEKQINVNSFDMLFAGELLDDLSIGVANLTYEWASSKHMHSDDFNLLFANELIEKLILN